VDSSQAHCCETAARALIQNPPPPRFARGQISNFVQGFYNAKLGLLLSGKRGEGLKLLMQICIFLQLFLSGPPRACAAQNSLWINGGIKHSIVNSSLHNFLPVVFFLIEYNGLLIFGPEEYFKNWFESRNFTKGA